MQYGYGNRATYVDGISPVFNAYGNQSTWQGQFSETHTIGPTAANQFLVAGTYINGGNGVANPAQTRAVFPTDLNFWNEGNTFNSMGGWNWAYALPSSSGTTSYQVSDDLMKTRGNTSLGLELTFCEPIGRATVTIGAVRDKYFRKRLTRFSSVG